MISNYTPRMRAYAGTPRSHACEPGLFANFYSFDGICMSFNMFNLIP